MIRVKDLIAIMAIMIVFMYTILYLETNANIEDIPVQETQKEVQETTYEDEGYYPVTITIDDSYEVLDYESLKTHFESNYDYDAKLISIDECLAEIKIHCEEDEIDDIKEQLESDYLVHGYEILEFKRSDE